VIAVPGLTSYHSRGRGRKRSEWIGRLPLIESGSSLSPFQNRATSTEVALFIYIVCYSESRARNDRGPSMANFGDIYQCKITYSMNGCLAANVRTYKCVAVAGGGVTDSVILQAWLGHMNSRIRSMLTSTAAVTSWRLQKIHPSIGTELIHVPGASPGFAPAGGLPPATCGLISLRNEPGSWGSRGARFYVPFPSSAHNESWGKPNLTYINLLNQLGDRLVLNFFPFAFPGQLTMEPVVWRRHVSVGEWTSTYVSRKVWATQRRRAVPPWP